MKRLNIGCGEDILSGWVNCDKYPCNKDVKYIDINVLPLSLDGVVIPDNSFDCIRCYHVMEHTFINDASLMDEFIRITKPGGVIDIKLPCCSLVSYHSGKAFHGRFYFINFLKGFSQDACIDNPTKRIELIDFNKKSNMWQLLVRFFEFLELFFTSEMHWKFRKI